jgi:hypothetical protein
VNPKDEKDNHQHYFNASPTMLPYEMLMTQPQPPTPQYSIQTQPTPHPTQVQQQPQQKEWKKFDKVLIEILIGVFLLPIPLITLLGIGLIIDGVRRYWKLRRS